MKFIFIIFILWRFAESCQFNPERVSVCGTEGVCSWNDTLNWINCIVTQFPSQNEDAIITQPSTYYLSYVNLQLGTIAAKTLVIGSGIANQMQTLSIIGNELKVWGQNSSIEASGALSLDLGSFSFISNEDFTIYSQGKLTLKSGSVLCPWVFENRGNIIISPQLSQFSEPEVGFNADLLQSGTLTLVSASVSARSNSLTLTDQGTLEGTGYWYCYRLNWTGGFITANSRFAMNVSVDVIDISGADTKSLRGVKLNVTNGDLSSTLDISNGGKIYSGALGSINFHSMTITSSDDTASVEVAGIAIGQLTLAGNLSALGGSFIGSSGVSTFDISKNLAMNGGSTLQIYVVDTNTHTRISANIVSVNSPTLIFEFGTNFQPETGVVIEFMSFGAMTGDFGTINYVGKDVGACQISTQRRTDIGKYTLTFDNCPDGNGSSSRDIAKGQARKVLIIVGGVLGGLIVLAVIFGAFKRFKATKGDRERKERFKRFEDS